MSKHGQLAPWIVNPSYALVQSQPSTLVATWLASFCVEFDNKSAERSKRKKQSRLAAPKLEDGENSFLIKHLEEKKLIKERLTMGFREPFERTIDGRQILPFKEHGLRSARTAILKRFVFSLPARGKIRTSDNKADLSISRHSKLLSLDNAYVEGNKVFLGFIRLDCDAIFKSKQDCLERLADKVNEGTIPHLPHIIVGSTTKHGQFYHPHLIFILRDPVWNEKTNKQCRKRPVKLFDAVSLRLSAALLDIGVDPSAPIRTQRCKNPLSPHWETLTPNSFYFMTLQEYSQVLDKRVNRNKLVRTFADKENTMASGPSNELFNKLQDGGSKLLRGWYQDDHPNLKLSPEELTDALTADLGTQYAVDKTGKYVLKRVARYLVNTFDPRKLEKGKARGRLMHEMTPEMTTTDRQKTGALYTHSVRKERSEKLLNDAMLSLHARGTLAGISKSELAKIADVSRSYAYKHYDRIVSMITPERTDNKATCVKFAA